MKKRVLIVEDDKYFRFAVKKVIDWEAYGFEIAGEAVHGAAALEFLETQPVEVVITDMSMPVMNGIDLTGELKEKYPEILIIALSAYDDFEFVKESLKLGAQDYILKQDIEKENVGAIVQNCWEKHLKDMASDSQVREGIRNLLNGERENGPARKYLELCLNDQWGYYICKIENLNGEWVSVAGRKSFWLERSLLELHDKKEHIVFLPVKKEHSQKVQFEDQNQVLRELECMLVEESYLGGCSKRGSDIEKLHALSEEVREVIEIGTFSNKNKIRIWETEKERVKKRNKLYMEDPQLFSGIYTRQEAEATLEGLTETICMQMPSEEHIQRNYLQFLNMVAGNLNIEIGKLEFAKIKEALSEHRLVWDKHQACQQYLAHIFAEEMQNAIHPSVQQAIQYIKQNYTSDLSLGEIAETAALNESYFSGIFKRDIGKSIPEYLNEIRIEKAKELIVTTGLKNYEIAERVGFGNGSYFSTIFKKQTGVTIQEYRQRTAKKTLQS
ncbi:MAG: response regulator [Hespellia sp.]|nr:response regulator [Hespellia sp.]